MDFLSFIYMMSAAGLWLLFLLDIIFSTGWKEIQDGPVWGILLIVALPFIPVINTVVLWWQLNRIWDEWKEAKEEEA